MYELNLMATQKKSTKKGKGWRAKRHKYAADSETGKGQRQKNWTDIETETFATILASRHIQRDRRFHITQ